MMINNLGAMVDTNTFGNASLDSSKLNIAHINAQSIVPRAGGTKMDEIRHVFGSSLIDILGVSETWCKSHVSSRSISIEGYNLFRNDRPWNRGGGVGLYISNRLRATLVHEYMEEGSIEALFVKVKLAGSAHVVVGVIYLPRGDFSKCENLLSDVSSRYANLVVVGDFNTDLFCRGHQVRDICGRLNLSLVHNSLPTHYDPVYLGTSLIDFFLVSDVSVIKSKGQCQLAFLNSNHACIYASFDLQTLKAAAQFQFRDYSFFDFERCRQDVETVDFMPLYNNPDIDEKVSLFNAVVMELFERHIPLRTGRKYIEDNWMQRKEVRFAQINRNLAYRAYLEDRTQARYKVFCLYRNKVKAVIRKQRRRECISFFSECTPKQLWQKLRKIGATKADNSITQLTSEMQLDSFNEHCILPRLPISIDPPVNFASFMPPNGFTFRATDNAELYECVNQIKSEAIGADGVPLKFIKLIFPFISSHILHIINAAIMTSKFPRQWKIGRVIPTPKIKSPKNLTDYRPISVLSSMSKILETVLFKQMHQHLSNGGYISRFQSGFRKGYSSTTQTLNVVENIRHNIDDKLASVLLFLDFSKAFDGLSHNILVKKLYNLYGFGKTSCQLIFSFLSERFQYVEWNGKMSGHLRTSRGVPQGSIISPLLFMMYTNDILLELSFSQCYIYADDIQLLAECRGCNEARFEENVNRDLVSINEWAQRNFLSLNFSKTKAMFFSHVSYKKPSLIVNGVPIEYVDHYKSLGFYLDSNLNFKFVHEL